MALKSQLFAGDPKLEAAAKSHSAHIIQGARGPHVGKIQSALIQLDGASIAQSELTASHYGPSTAKAVLAYKTKRNIVNYTYQTKADDIVGIMTMNTLDEELSTRLAPPLPRQRGPHAFFVTADVGRGRTPGEVLRTFGLDRAGQRDALRDPHNAHLHGNLVGGVSDGQLDALAATPVATATTVVVPIDVRLSVLQFQPFETLFPTGNETSTTHHGVSVRIGRNLLVGSALNWIQTVKKLNNPDPKAPVEFVDIGLNNEPFFDFSLPRGTPAPPVFVDNPSAPVASRVDFTAMTTLAVLVRGHIILAAGKVWRYVLTGAPTLTANVRTTPPRDATAADFQNQLRILRIGQNQLRGPTGPHLDYVVRPTPGTVIT
jgi:peptidoglycan hydrolase-like protein with peptidoglycan-binding domain